MGKAHVPPTHFANCYELYSVLVAFYFSEEQKYTSVPEDTIDSVISYISVCKINDKSI